MESVVIDASLLVAAVLNAGPNDRWARGIIASKHLIAPQLAPIEAAHVLRRAEMANEISSLQATGGYRKVVGFPIDLLPFGPYAERIWELRSNLTPYDAWYVACAEALAVPLATLDARLSRAPGPRCRFLLPDPGRASPGESS